jgi:predicted KAP-like P-loop ATPase
MKPKKKTSIKRKAVAPGYSSDRPIKSVKSDLLGRSKFATRLIGDVHAWDASDSLVIALYGAWGSGKTSLKNMVLELNEGKGEAKLPVLEFNPWQLSGTGQITDRFLKELGIALNRQGSKRDIEESAKQLDAYAKMLAVGGGTASAIGKIMPWLGVPGGPLVESAGAALKSSAESAEIGGKALEAKRLSDAITLDEQKEKLSNMLSKRKVPLLVVIDDIDRLTTDEILAVFQVVKANADFPKVIYLLLFERKIVAEALDKISGGKGMEFLEKIIQVGYHIPSVTSNSVQRVLFSSLDKLLEGSPAQRYWNKRRWSNLYLGGVSGYFTNLRQVYRFLASFNFHFRHHVNGSSSEVNPVDLIGLEVLRVFEPLVYERIVSAKVILTREDERRLFGKVKQEIVDEGLEQILSLVPEHRRKFARTILTELFPPLGGENSSGDKDQWLREARICNGELFDKYFSLSVGSDDLTQAELDELLANRANPVKFRLACEALQSRGLIKLALERLEAYKETTLLDQMEPFIEALCNICDGLPEKEHGMFETSPSITVFRLVYFGLKREADPQKRLLALRNAFTRADGLSLALELTNTELRERNGANKLESYEFLVEEADAVPLKEICLEKARSAAKQGSLKNNAKIKEILYAWSRMGSVQEVKNWVMTHVKDGPGALWLLEILLGESHSWGHEHRVSYGIELGAIERFADLAAVTKHVATLKAEGLSKRQAHAVAAFNRAIERRKAGRADDPWTEADRHAHSEIVDD